MSPASVAVAMPMWKYFRKTSSFVVSSSAVLSIGCFLSDAVTAFTMKGRKLSFTPCASAGALRLARIALSFVTSHSSTNVKCAAVCFDCAIFCEIFRRTPAKGIRSSSGPRAM